MSPSIFHCWLNDLYCTEFPIPPNHSEKQGACHCFPFCYGGFVMSTIAEICVPWWKIDDHRVTEDSRAFMNNTRSWQHCLSIVCGGRSCCFGKIAHLQTKIPATSSIPPGQHWGCQDCQRRPWCGVALQVSALASQAVQELSDTLLWAWREPAGSAGRDI